MVKHRGKCQPAKRTKQSKHAPAESGSEVRFQNNCDRHGQPIGTVPAYAALDHVSDSDTQAETNGVAEDRRLRVKIGAQRREPSSEL